MSSNLQVILTALTALYLQAMYSNMTLCVLAITGFYMQLPPYAFLLLMHVVVACRKATSSAAELGRNLPRHRARRRARNARNARNACNACNARNGGGSATARHSPASIGLACSVHAGPRAAQLALRDRGATARLRQGHADFFRSPSPGGHRPSRGLNVITRLGEH